MACKKCTSTAKPEQKKLTTADIIARLIEAEGPNAKTGTLADLFALGLDVQKRARVTAIVGEIITAEAHVEALTNQAKTYKAEIKELQKELLDAYNDVEQLDLVTLSQRHSGYFEAAAEMERENPIAYALVFEPDSDVVRAKMATANRQIITEARDFVRRWLDVGSWPDGRTADLEYAAESGPPKVSKIEQVHDPLNGYTPPKALPKSWRDAEAWLDENANDVFQVLMADAPPPDLEAAVLALYVVVTFRRAFEEDRGVEAVNDLIDALSSAIAGFEAGAVLGAAAIN